ncbi:calcium-dependent protein kinase 28-like protein [Tanacetum coccineum]
MTMNTGSFSVIGNRAQTLYLNRLSSQKAATSQILLIVTSFLYWENDSSNFTSSPGATSHNFFKKLDANGCSQIVDLKMILPVRVKDVKQEVKILRALSGHENVVQFHNAFEDDYYVYIAMEYVCKSCINVLRQ